MKGPEADKLRVRHILDAINEVEGYLNGVNFYIVWEIATINLPELKSQFSEIKTEFES